MSEGLETAEICFLPNVFTRASRVTLPRLKWTRWCPAGFVSTSLSVSLHCSFGDVHHLTSASPLELTL